MSFELPITNGYYTSRHLPLSHQRCSNCYINIPTVATLSKEQLFFTPGILGQTTTGSFSEVNRGSHVKNGIAYYVNGNTLYSLDRTITVVAGIPVASFGTTALGTISGTGRVEMADNGTQLFILVPGGAGYIYNEDDVTPFQTIVDADFTANGNPQTVRYVDGYFLLTTDSKKFIVSSLNDGLSYNALDATSAEADPDAIVTSMIISNQVYILGSETTEGFSNAPTPGRPPFVRNGVVIDKGCFAPFSVVKTNSTFVMIGGGVDEKPAVWVFAGNNYTRISTPAIDNLLSTYTDTQVSAIFAMAYGDEGEYFVTFTLPDTTIVYNFVSQRWTERNSVLNETERAWRVNSIITAYGLTLVGDSIDGRIGSLDIDCVTEYDSNITRLFTTQPFTDQGDEITPVMLELTVESGTGNAAVPNPVVSMASSSNGKTFSAERVKKIGKVGEYGQRVVWYRNGRFDRLAVLLFRLSEPVKTAFLKLEME